MEAETHMVYAKEHIGKQGNNHNLNAANNPERLPNLSYVISFSVPHDQLSNKKVFIQSKLLEITRTKTTNIRQLKE